MSLSESVNPLVCGLRFRASKATRYGPTNIPLADWNSIFTDTYLSLPQRFLSLLQAVWRGIKKVKPIDNFTTQLFSHTEGTQRMQWCGRGNSTRFASTWLGFDYRLTYSLSVFHWEKAQITLRKLVPRNLQTILWNIQLFHAEAQV